MSSAHRELRALLLYPSLCEDGKVPGVQGAAVGCSVLPAWPQPSGKGRLHQGFQVHNQCLELVLRVTVHPRTVTTGQ